MHTIDPRLLPGAPYFLVGDVLDLAGLVEELSAAGADVAYGPVDRPEYRMREFAVRDLGGYVDVSPGPARRIRPAGDVPAYSTYGIALAGLLVQDVSGVGLEAYLRRNIWTPLAMEQTSMGVPQAPAKHVAVGYEVQDGVNRPQPWEWYQKDPASDINSTAADMAKYMLAHLGSPIGRGTTVLSAATRRAMQARQATGHPRINGFTYGFQENAWHGHGTVEHGGDMSGFSSLLVMLPQFDAGIFIAHHHGGERLRYEVADAIIGQMFGTGPDVLAPPASPATRSSTGRYAGTWSWPQLPRESLGHAVDITNNEDGTLSMIGRRWTEVEPLFFVSADGQNRLAFREDTDGAVRYMFLGNVDAFEKVAR